MLVGRGDEHPAMLAILTAAAWFQGRGAPAIERIQGVPLPNVFKTRPKLGRLFPKAWRRVLPLGSLELFS